MKDLKVVVGVRKSKPKSEKAQKAQANQKKQNSNLQKLLNRIR